ncbi:MAG: ferredoxin family protein [Bacteroidota bacterium]|jgi:2-oxoglutarate ferredoxin oxidoreductase subunit delta
MIRGTIIVATEICKACELCIAACPQDCLELSSNLNLKGYRYVQLKNDSCTGCINCAIVCPDSAITVYRQPKAIKSATSKNSLSNSER